MDSDQTHAYANAHKEIPGNPSTAKSSTLQLNTRENGETLRVLTEEQWNFWIQKGYIVIKNAISREQAGETAAFLWTFEEKKPKDPSTWYTAPRAEMQMKELAGTGMVEVYNNQHLWNNRQSQKVYDAFVDVWGTEKLWVTIDRANLNFPIKKGYEYKGFIHWDYDPETKPENVQGSHRTYPTKRTQIWEAFNAYPGCIKITSVGNSPSHKTVTDFSPILRV